MTWACPSTKPGSRTLSAKRSSSVALVKARMSSGVPTITMRPSRTATWVATGRDGFIVMILRAAKMVVAWGTGGSLAALDVGFQPRSGASSRRS